MTSPEQPVEATAETRKEVYASFGAAAFWAASFEAELAIALLAQAHRENRKVNPAELNGLGELLSRKTVGALLDELKHHFQLPASFEATLREYVRERNYLIHHFWALHVEALRTDVGCNELLRELSELSHRLYLAWDTAKLLTSSLVANVGMSRQQLAAEREALLALGRQFRGRGSRRTRG